MPLRQPAPVRIVDALLGNGENSFFGEKELLDRPFIGRMAAIGSVAFKSSAIKGRDSTLGMYKR